MHAAGWVFAGLAAAGLAAGAGCAPGGTAGANRTADRNAKRAPTPQEVMQMPLEPNIVQVATHYSTFNPWIWAADKSKPRGLVISSVYLSRAEPKGVFGDGIIRARLYTLEPTPEGGQKPVLVKEWPFDVEQAMPWRAKKETAMGWGYRLPLDWGDLDLSGKEIRVIVAFERPDGRIVESGKKDFRVPTTAR